MTETSIIKNISITTNEEEKINELAIEFNALNQSSVASILEMCRIAYEAKSTYKTKAFTKFLEKVSFVASPSTISKYVKIGEKYEALSAYKSQLPIKWTSIYIIAKQDRSQILNAFASGKLCPTSTSEDIRRIFNLPSSTKQQTTIQSTYEASMHDDFCMKLFFDENTIKSNSAKINEAIQMLKDAGIEVEMTAALTNAINME